MIFLKKVKSALTDGFSLIELMISLITISCIAGAFTPIITKKLKNSNISVALSEITAKCSQKFGEECKLCYAQKCVVCNKTCGAYQYKNVETCKCEDCSDRGEGCAWCDGKYCTSCYAGYGFDSSTHTCTKCAPGYISDGSKPCEPCKKGTFQKDYGQNKCNDSTAGHYVPEEGSENETPCDYGYYQNEGHKESCNPCAKGHAQPNRGKKECIICENGYYQPDEHQQYCLEADYGHYTESGPQTSQTPCDYGYYQDAKHQSSCTPCPSNLWTSKKGLSYCDIDCPEGFDCVNKKNCLPGSYSPAGSPTCTTCSDGTIQAETGKGNCTPCDAKKWSNDTHTACVNCPAGWECHGNKDRAQCTSGYYSTGGASSCTSCGDGYYSITGATSQSDCKQCPANCKTCSQDGSCTECKNGFKISGTECIAEVTCKGTYVISTHSYLGSTTKAVKPEGACYCDLKKEELNENNQCTQIALSQYWEPNDNLTLACKWIKDGRNSWYDCWFNNEDRARSICLDFCGNYHSYKYKIIPGK